uniref:Cytochrome P450 n=1 Tax=Rhodonia placenta TaxID=104341 RepID=F1SYA0_9APHY|nr:cytochrome P450 [Postia placenta]
MLSVLSSIETLDMAVALLALLSYLLYILWNRKLRTVYPPGPTPIPFLGNFCQLPVENQHEKFQEWAQTYGNIVYAQLFRTPLVLLNSLDTIQDLMVKKGAIYSDRPQFVLWEDIYGFKPIPTSLNADDDWREHRKWMQSALETDQALVEMHPLLRSSVDKLLMKLVNSPDAFFAHVQRYTSELTIDIAYGMDKLTADDRYHRIAQDAVDAIAHGSSLFAALVDFFPILKYIPAWVPGSAYNSYATRARNAVYQMINEPFNLLLETMASGVYKPSFASVLIEAKSENGQLSTRAESHIKGAAATVYAAGAETSADVVLTLILAMLLHPNVSEKAQKEIDSVVGPDRLPEFHDRKRLPYLESVLSEVHRWNPPAPLGVPHRLKCNDEYKGYFIPKGASIISNIWAISRDTSIYPDPDTFWPERFGQMDAETFKAYDPKKYVFGFGRRVCPGRHLADLTTWLAAANILATMDIRKARDHAGAEIEPKVSFVSALTRGPQKFACSICPRSLASVELIKQQLPDKPA